MSRAKLPPVSFETGLLIRRRIPDLHRRIPRKDFVLIGKAGDTPFCLAYRGGVTSWWCQERLGDSLRKKILGVLREEIRYGETLPAYIVEHDIRESDELDLNASSRAASDVELAFFNDVWRGVYLDDRDEDYVALAVPFAEKDEAKALGAKWDAQERVWKVKRQEDMSAFARWMPEEAGNSRISLKM